MFRKRGFDMPVEGLNRARLYGILTQPLGARGKVIFAMVAVVVLLLVHMRAAADETREVNWWDLPYQETFAGPVNVRLHIRDMPAPAVLQVNMSTSIVYDAGLYRDGVYMGKIENPLTVFSVPVSTAETNLTFLARDLTVRVMQVGREGMIRNGLERVVFAGYT